MKYLFTGFYPGTTKESPTMGIRTSRVALTKTLRDMGHTVYYGPPTQFYTDNYDAVFIVLFPTFTFNAKHSPGIFDLVRNQGVSKFFLLDDWRVIDVYRDYERTKRLASCVYDERRMKVLGHIGPYVPGNAEAFYNTMISEPHTVYYPAYESGDHRLIESLVTRFNPNVHFKYFDPSNAFEPYPVQATTAQLRHRCWVEANLGSDHSDISSKLSLGWPIEFFGGKRKDHGIRLPECELAQRYAENWGVAAYPYPHAGSGWWRNRYNMAADCDCLVAASDRDLEVLGLEMYSPRIVEGMDFQGLRYAAKRTSEAIYNRLWSRSFYEEFVKMNFVEPLR